MESVAKKQKEFEYEGKCYVDLESAALELPFSASHLRYMAGRKEIPARRIGRRWFFNLDDVKQALVHGQDKENGVSRQHSDLDDI